MEGRIAATAIDALAQRDGLDLVTRERLRGYLAIFDQISEGLGFCLSEDGDVLSQWRGYTADGSGIAIGFSAGYLNWLADQPQSGGSSWAFRLQQVKYQPAEHQAEVEPTYQAAKKLIDQGAFRITGVRSLLDSRTDEQLAKEAATFERKRTELSMVLLAGLFAKLYLLKSQAFQEEKEWRLISHRLLAAIDVVSYRSASDRLIAYRSYKLLDAVPPLQPITDVVLGPKLLTPVHMVKVFLKERSFGHVSVRRSAASYR
jgi:hypothetical protein